MRKLVFSLLALVLVAGSAMAVVDRDNNGIAGDEPTYHPAHYSGQTYRDQTIVFPTTGDTYSVASYPYWWHIGDTVYGMHTVSHSYRGDKFGGVRIPHGN